jgi:CBS domain-containing protein
MTVAAVLRQKGSSVISVAPGDSVAAAAEVIVRRRIGAVVVLDGEGRLVGILSERDIVRGLTQHGAALLALPVSALMTQAVQVVGPETSVDEAMEIMDAGYFRHLPVQGADGKLCGIVSIRDLVRYRITAQQSDVESLQAYVIGRGYALGRV